MWDLIYAVLDTLIMILLFHRMWDRWRFDAYFSGGVMLFLGLIYAHLAALRWGIFIHADVLDILNDPRMVLSRTVPLMLLLWLSRGGREWFGQRGGRPKRGK